MSPRILKLLELFSDKRSVREESESQVELNGTYDTNSITVPEAQQLKDALDNFPKRDNVSLLVVIDGSEPTLFKTPGRIQRAVTMLGEHTQEVLKERAGPISGCSKTGDISEIQAQLDQLRKKKVAADVGAASSLVLAITKRLKDGEATLYSPDLFLSHLERCSLTDRLAIFSEFIEQAGAVKFVCDEPLVRFGSKTITFAVESEHGETHDRFDRAALLAKRDDVAHFVGGAIYKLAPDDFNLIESGTNQQWQRVFKELTNVLAVAFTADYTTFADGNTLNFKINGYKTLTGSFNCNDLTGANWTAAFKIYDWAYQGGAISDKVGLLRNVLSLYLDDTGRPRYTEDVYKSVCSGFAIYLRENVQQYIEIKKTLSDFLRNLSRDALGEVEKYADALKGTLGALMTFFISTVILSAIGGRGLLGIFTTDITYLTYAFLAGSVVYLSLSLILLNRKRKTMGDHYRSLKEQHKDILDPNDLDTIFPDDRLDAITKEVKSQAALITVAWIMITLILGAVAFSLHRKQALLPAPTSQETKSAPTTQEQTPSLKNEH